MGEQFCLRWNNHQSTLVSVFENLLDSGTLIDCTLYADGQLLRAHKVVLTACSPIFESMLKVQEDKHPIIFLKDVKFVEMKAMLDYMYKGEVNILQDNLDSFLKTAAALEIKGLTDQGGGGGEGEPPAKKGPGRKTGMSDVAPESPLVGNAPLRDGSISPSSRKRRRQRRPSPTPDDHSADNSCDIPALPATPITTPAAPQMTTDNRTSTPMNETRLLTVKKQEPLDTPIIQPKTEYMEEPSEDIEDLTIDDDDDYGDMSDMSRPGTSYGMSQGGSQADLSNWQSMMATDRLGQDEVFNAANEAINSQANTQELLVVNLFCCSQCGKTYGSRGALGKHTRLKHQIQQLESTDEVYYTVESTDEVYYTVESTKIEASFDCSQCGNKYKSRKALKKHVSYQCGKEPTFSCPECPYKAKLKHYLKSHLESRHEIYTPASTRTKIQGPFYCSLCGKMYLKRKSLKSHVKFQCGKEPTFSCPKCPYKAKYKHSLKKHLEKIHEVYTVVISQPE